MTDATVWDVEQLDFEEYPIATMATCTSEELANKFKTWLESRYPNSRYGVSRKKLNTYLGSDVEQLMQNK